MAMAMGVWWVYKSAVGNALIICSYSTGNIPVYPLHLRVLVSDFYNKSTVPAVTLLLNDKYPSLYRRMRSPKF